MPELFGYDDRLRLDYERTLDLLRELTDVRFKLLALVPTLSGAAVGLLGRRPDAPQLLSVGVLGLAATVGVLLYELRNTQLAGYALERATCLERELGFASAFTPVRRGGLVTERPAGRSDRALALVHGAAIAGWSYLVAWGLLHALDVTHARQTGLAVGALCGLLVVAGSLRLDGRRASSREPAPARAGGGAPSPSGTA